MSQRPEHVRSRRLPVLVVAAAAAGAACASPTAPPPSAQRPTDEPIAMVAAPARPAAGGVASVGRPFTAAPAGGPMLLPPPSIAGSGALALTEVSAEVERRLGALNTCYQRRLDAMPMLAGAVVIHWTIGDEGQVVESCVTEDTVEDPAVVACVNQLVTTGSFPAPRGGTVSVSFPFVFTPRAPA